MIEVRVFAEPFDPGAELTRVTKALGPVGALVSFTGIVRDLDGGLEALEIEHYPAMTEAALREMAEAAQGRFGLAHIAILHRHGRLAPGEPIMAVMVAAAHRKEAFQGADFLMDYLKSRAPFWKKEHRASGAEWVAAKAADEEALEGWASGAP